MECQQDKTQTWEGTRIIIINEREFPAFELIFISIFFHSNHPPTSSSSSLLHSNHSTLQFFIFTIVEWFQSWIWKREFENFLFSLISFEFLSFVLFFVSFFQHSIKFEKYFLTPDTYDNAKKRFPREWNRNFFFHPRFTIPMWSGWKGGWFRSTRMNRQKKK